MIMMYRWLSFGRSTFEASDEGLRLAPTVIRGFSVAIAICGLVWLLNPDLFGLVPNSLDPMFYTGYAINLDDALAVAGNRHYFVTRWSSYLPMYLFSEMFGPFWGRLFLRLAMILTLAEVFWRFTHRYQVKPIVRLLEHADVCKSIHNGLPRILHHLGNDGNAVTCPDG